MKDPKLVEEILESKDYQELVKLIFNYFYDKKFTKNRAYNTPIGTSCLIKNNNPTKIFIVKRKVNYSTPDCVCITDKEREEYFSILRSFNIEKINNLYAILKDNNKELYNLYEDFMNRRYQEQL